MDINFLKVLDKYIKKREASGCDKTRAQIVSENVRDKQKANPNYIPSKVEGKMLRIYAEECNKKLQQKENERKKDVLNKIRKMERRKTAKTFLPGSTQDDLPYKADYEEGLFEVEPNKYSKCYEIMDINYFDAKEEEGTVIFCKWAEFLNYFSDEVSVCLYIDNRIISIQEQEKKIFLKLQGDSNDVHRKELNRILEQQIQMGRNNIHQNKYFTVTIEAESPYEALMRFHKIDPEVIRYLRKAGSSGRVLSTEERLEMLHDKMRKGSEGEFQIDFDFLKAQGLSSKDYIAPSSFLFEKNYLVVGDTYHRCMYVCNLPASLSDDFLNDMSDCNFPVTIAVNINPIDQAKAKDIVLKQLTGMTADVQKAKNKARAKGLGEASINPDLEHSLEEARQLLDDLLYKNQKLFYVSILIMASGNTIEELEENCKLLKNKARTYPCQLQVFDNQQRDAYKITLPMGVTTSKKVYVDRTLTTDSTAIFIPFAHQELFQEHGNYIGLNQNTRNIIFCDRSLMKTPSGFILGSSGSGKSFLAKEQIGFEVFKDTRSDILVIDPEDEYGAYAMALGATVFRMGNSSDYHLNPFDMTPNYGLDEKDDPDAVPMEKKKEKALKKKTEFIMTIISSKIGSLTAQHKSVIDRVTRRTFKEFLDHDFDEKFIPTFVEFQNELDKEKKTPEAVALAESCEYFTKGFMNLFSYKTNLDFENRFVVFSIRDLGKEMMNTGLLIILEFIWNRMVKNGARKKKTKCIADEIHLLFSNPMSENYMQQYYQRGRKYGLEMTGITQDVDKILKSEVAKIMIFNSDFIVMLNQKGDNLRELVELLGMSETQASYLKNAEPGCGLLSAQKVIIPFVNHFPEDSYLYSLISTKFGEESDDKTKLYIENIIKNQQREHL